MLLIVIDDDAPVLETADCAVELRLEAVELTGELLELLLLLLLLRRAVELPPVDDWERVEETPALLATTVDDGALLLLLLCPAVELAPVDDDDKVGALVLLATTVDEAVPVLPASAVDEEDEEPVLLLVTGQIMPVWHTTHSPVGPHAVPLPTAGCVIFRVCHRYPSPQVTLQSAVGLNQGVMTQSIGQTCVLQTRVSVITGQLSG
ncbi:MAG: hypothetical protein P4L87_14240, partial [Formivibrio sp.]|nr:hypothetical protein [Formivibrio sp.]